MPIGLNKICIREVKRLPSLLYEVFAPSGAISHGRVSFFPLALLQIFADGSPLCYALTFQEEWEKHLPQRKRREELPLAPAKLGITIAKTSCSNRGEEILLCPHTQQLLGIRIRVL